MGEEIKKESVEVDLKADNASSVDKIVTDENKEIPKEEGKNEGGLKAFRIPKKAGFASKGDINTEKIKEEHKRKEEHKMKGDHKMKEEHKRKEEHKMKGEQVEKK